VRLRTQKKFDEAIRCYEDSLMENRDPGVEKILKALQREKKLAAEAAYKNPELAEVARQEGNELFKQGKRHCLSYPCPRRHLEATAAPTRSSRPPTLVAQTQQALAFRYPEAIAKYSDAMRRDPTSATPYSNRAACYQKLMEWQLALKDAETCVTMDPKFVKGWSRKAAIHLFLKEYHKSMDCYNMVLELEPENGDAKANLEHVVAKINEANQTGEADPERQKRAMADPEIQV